MLALACIASLSAASLSAQVDRFAARALAEAPAAGMTVAVSRAGKPVLVKGYGLANLEWSAPAGADTVYRIASVSKQFTAAEVMLLVEEKRVGLDDPVSPLLPEAQLGKPVTVRQLLSHTSGLISTTSLGPRFWKQIRDDHTPAELLQSIGPELFHFEPGARYEYSNTNYLVLGLLIEKLTGLPYAQAMDAVFRKAGLRATSVCDNARITPGRAAGYSTAATRLQNAEPIGAGNAFGAGELCSTAPDLLRWVEALASGAVVSPESYLAMTTPTRTADGKTSDYGFGLGLADLEGHLRVWHGGAINGFATSVERYPREGVAVVVLVNTEGDAADLVAEQVARAALGLAQRKLADLPVPLEQARRYAGVYLSAGGQRFVVGLSGDRLELHPEADAADQTPLFYQGPGPGDFVLKGSPRHLRFNETAGKVASLSLGDGKRWYSELQRGQ